jgi:hypothetical protein
MLVLYQFFGTFPKPLIRLPLYESLSLDHSGAPRDIPDPIQDTGELLSHHYEYPITILAPSNVKCVTLLVREYMDMVETPLRSIINI